MDKTKMVKNILSTVMMMVDVEDLQHRSVYFPWYNYVRNYIYIYKNSSSADVIFFSWALPNTNCHSPSKKHIKKIFDFMCELKAITFSHYCMPGWTKLFVHAFFYHFCSSLKHNTVHIWIITMMMTMIKLFSPLSFYCFILTLQPRWAEGFKPNQNWEIITLTTNDDIFVLLIIVLWLSHLILTALIHLLLLLNDLSQALNNSRFPLTFWMADRNKASIDFW